MSQPPELRTYLRRTSDGRYRLVAEDGRLLMQRNSYRELRRDLPAVLAALPVPCHRVKILIGSPAPVQAARSGARPQACPPPLDSFL
jgi:hypothetical protein